MNENKTIYTVLQKMFTLLIFTITKSDVDQFLQRVSIALAMQSAVLASVPFITQ